MLFLIVRIVQLQQWFNPDFAVGIVARRRKPLRDAQLERFCNDGIFVNMLRSKIVKQALQQGFSSRSRWLLQILGLKEECDGEIEQYDYETPFDAICSV